MKVTQEQKDLINHVLDGGEVQWYDSADERWSDPVDFQFSEFVQDVISPMTYSSDVWRKKPETITTYLWVAEWEVGPATCVRYDSNPWPIEGHIDPVAVYKIEESKREEEL